MQLLRLFGGSSWRCEHFRGFRQIFLRRHICTHVLFATSLQSTRTQRESSISAQSIHANTSAKANLSKTGFHLCHSFRCLSHLSCKHSQFGHPRMTYSDGQSLTGGQDASSVPANSIRTKVDPVYLRQAVVQEFAISRDL